MRANDFFSGTVRIQEDRGQTVATGGPYRWVRHPGYVGGILHHLAAPPMLGSFWALIPGVLGALALVARTALEDRTLYAELDGYAAYATRTRYRLVPWVW
jgi:protein-S-isoprenylcysteine O-methyltransferase Ste14